MGWDVGPGEARRSDAALALEHEPAKDSSLAGLQIPVAPTPALTFA